MFNKGDRVRFVRHDQYPTLVGLVGLISGMGREDPGPTAASATGGAVYQVITESRTLHDIPEAWLEPLRKGRPHAEPAPAGSVAHPWWKFWGQ